MRKKIENQKRRRRGSKREKERGKKKENEERRGARFLQGLLGLVKAQ